MTTQAPRISTNVFAAMAEGYWQSKKARQLAADPRTSLQHEPATVTSPAVLEYHFFRFLDGASDDHAILGWRAYMDRRQAAILGKAPELKSA